MSLVPRLGPRPRTVKRPTPNVIPQFQPGDLITADQLNAMVDTINALRTRVAALEAAARNA